MSHILQPILYPSLDSNLSSKILGSKLGDGKNMVRREDIIKGAI